MRIVATQHPGQDASTNEEQRQAGGTNGAGVMIQFEGCPERISFRYNTYLHSPWRQSFFPSSIGGGLQARTHCVASEVEGRSEFGPTD